MKKLFLVALTATTLISNLNAFTVTFNSKEIGAKLANAGTSLANATVGKLGNKVLPYYAPYYYLHLDKSKKTPANIAGTATLLCAVGGTAYVGYKVRNWWNSLYWHEKKDVKEIAACASVLTLYSAGIIAIAKKKF